MRKCFNMPHFMLLLGSILVFQGSCVTTEHVRPADLVEAVGMDEGDTATLHTYEGTIRVTGATTVTIFTNPRQALSVDVHLRDLRSEPGLLLFPPYNTASRIAISEMSDAAITVPNRSGTIALTLSIILGLALVGGLAAFSACCSLGGGG